MRTSPRSCRQGLNAMQIRFMLSVTELGGKQWDRVKAHLYYSESESDVVSNLLHCFQSVYLYYSDKDQIKRCFRSSINEPLGSPLTPAIYYATAITTRFKNGLYTHFCDCDSYLLHRKESHSKSCNKS